MGYAKEFNHLFYNVPEFLTLNADWEDMSWHNDVCPRWENKEIGLAIWVDNLEPELREYDDWKQYTVVKITEQSDGTTVLADDIEFATEDAIELRRWIALFKVRQHVEAAQSFMNNLDEPIEEIADGLADTLARLNTFMNHE